MSITYVTEPPRAEDYLQVFETSGWNDVYGVSVSDLRRSLCDSRWVVAAYDGDLLVGIGRAISDGVLYALVVDIIVLPGYRSRGIGSHIVEMLVACCKNAGVRDIKLFAAVGKAPFYKRLGFTQRPDDRPGMALRLVEGQKPAALTDG